MNASGSGGTEVTHEYVDGVENNAADSSDEGTRVLANRNGCLRIVDVAIGTQAFPAQGGVAARAPGTHPCHGCPG